MKTPKLSQIPDFQNESQIPVPIPEIWNLLPTPAFTASVLMTGLVGWVGLAGLAISSGLLGIVGLTGRGKSVGIIGSEIRGCTQFPRFRALQLAQSQNKSSICLSSDEKLVFLIS